MKKNGSLGKFFVLALALGILSLGSIACGKSDTASQETTAAKEGSALDKMKEKIGAAEKNETEAGKTEKETTEKEVSTEAAKEETEETLDYASLTAEDLMKEYEGKTELSDEDMKKLLSTYQYVPITDTLELEQNITDEALYKLRDNGTTTYISDEAIAELTQHEAPQVRGEAVGWMDSFFGMSDTNRQSLHKLIETETDPFVLKSMARALGNEGGSDEAAAAFLLDITKHEDPRVRQAAAMYLGTSWNEGMEGAVDAMLTMMGDEDADVREAAYYYAGELNDERIIDPIVECLNDESQAELHDEGINSLVELWLNYPFHERYSEKAYRATMDYMEKTPRSEEIPSWSGVSCLQFINSDEATVNAWKEKATFYDPAEIVNAMTEIIKDPDADWLARTSAVSVIASHGGLDAMNALKDTIDGLSDDDADFVKNDYERELKDLQK